MPREEEARTTPTVPQHSDNGEGREWCEDSASKCQEGVKKRESQKKREDTKTFKKQSEQFLLVVQRMEKEY